MLLRSSITGIIITLLLALLLACSRLFTAEEPDVVELTEVEVVELSPPPPPPDLAEPEQQSEDQLPPPPAPKVEVPQNLTTPDMPEIALALRDVPLTTPVANFQSDAAPAPMPAPPKPKPKPKVAESKPAPQKATRESTPTRRSSPAPSRTAPKRPAPTKSHYSASELDSLPRERRTGKFRWPSSAKGTSGTVKLYIEIDTSGRVKVLSVVSSTNSALNRAAQKIASGSRFTSPTRKGKPVKARFYKTYQLKKP